MATKKKASSGAATKARAAAKPAVKAAAKPVAKAGAKPAAKRKAAPKADKPDPTPFKLFLWQAGQDRATVLVSAATAGMPAGWTPSEHAPLAFSKDGQRLFLGTTNAADQWFTEGDTARWSPSQMTHYGARESGAPVPATGGDWALSLGILVVTVGLGLYLAWLLWTSVAAG